jgi:hypothetical protein
VFHLFQKIKTKYYRYKKLKKIRKYRKNRHTYDSWQNFMAYLYYIGGDKLEDLYKLFPAEYISRAFWVGYLEFFNEYGFKTHLYDTKEYKKYCVNKT